MPLSHDNRNRTWGGTWQDMKCLQSILSILIIYSWKRREGWIGWRSLHIFRSKQCLKWWPHCCDSVWHSTKCPYRSVFGCHIWLAVPWSWLSIFRRWLLIRRSSMLCQRVYTCPQRTVTSPSVMCLASMPRSTAPPLARSGCRLLYTSYNINEHFSTPYFLWPEKVECIWE